MTLGLPILNQVALSRRPTVEARVALYGTAQRQAEDARSQIRKQRDAVAKGFKKHHPEYEEVRTSALSCEVLAHDVCSIRSSWTATLGM